MSPRIWIGLLCLLLLGGVAAVAQDPEVPAESQPPDPVLQPPAEPQEEPARDKENQPEPKPAKEAPKKPEVQKHDIQWSFKQGETLRYELTQTMQTKVADVDIEMRMAFVTAHQIVEVEESGAAELRITYERVRVHMDGMMETDYDSGKDKDLPDDPLGRMMAAFVGKSFSLRMSPHGRVLEVRGMKRIMDQIRDELKEQDDSGLGAALTQQYTDDYMKQMMQLSYGILPGQPVAREESWKSGGTLPMQGIGKLSLKNTSTLREVRGDTAVVQQKTEVSIEIDPGQDPTEGLLEFDDADGEFEMEWDMKNGRMASYQGTFDMSMSAGGQDLTMSLSLRMRLLRPGAEDKKDF